MKVYGTSTALQAPRPLQCTSLILYQQVTCCNRYMITNNTCHIKISATIHYTLFYTLLTNSKVTGFLSYVQQCSFASKHAVNIHMHDGTKYILLTVPSTSIEFLLVLSIPLASVYIKSNCYS